MNERDLARHPGATSAALDLMAMPAGYEAAKAAYGRLVRRALRNRTGPGRLTEVGRLLGKAWSIQYDMPTREKALAEAKAIIKELQ